MPAMLLVFVLLLGATAAAAPLIRTQAASKRPLEHDVSLDETGHAALSRMLPIVAPKVVGSTSAQVTVFLVANSGNKLSRESLGTPLAGPEEGESQLSLTDSSLLWKDTTGSEAEWILAGSDSETSDGSDVFIKCGDDTYLVDGGDGTVYVSTQQTGAWKLTAASHGRVTLTSAKHNYLKEDASGPDQGTPGVVTTQNEGDDTKFTITLKHVNWHVPYSVLSGPSPPPRLPDLARPTTEINNPAHKPQEKTNKLNVFIISKKNGGHLRYDGSTLDLNGAWDDNSKWSIVDSGEELGKVFIASKNGAYLRDFAGSLAMDTISDNIEDKMWSLVYDSGYDMTAMMGWRRKYIEDEENVLQLTPDDADVKIEDPEYPDHRVEALFTLQIAGVSLYEGT